MDIAALKIAIIGEQGVGKTSLVLRYTKNTFQESYMPTLGADFAVKEERLASGKKVQLYLWDLAGNPMFRGMRQYYLHGSHAVIVCFAVNDPGSFEASKVYLKEIRRERARNLPIIFAGTKADLDQAINQDDIDRACKDESIPFLRTSARTGENVHELFLKVVTTAMQ
jgi:Ras-related protein Rab-1A